MEDLFAPVYDLMLGFFGSIKNPVLKFIVEIIAILVFTAIWIFLSINAMECVSLFIKNPYVALGFKVVVFFLVPLTMYLILYGLAKIIRK